MQSTVLQPPTGHTTYSSEIQKMSAVSLLFTGVHMSRTAAQMRQTHSGLFCNQKHYFINVINLKINFLFHLMVPAVVAGKQHGPK